MRASGWLAVAASFAALPSCRPEPSPAPEPAVVFRTFEHPHYVGKLPGSEGLVGLRSIPSMAGANPAGTVAHVTVRGAPLGDVTTFLDGDAPLAARPAFGFGSIGAFTSLAFRGEPTLGVPGDHFAVGTPPATGAASIEGLGQTLALTLGACFDDTGCDPGATPPDLELDLAFEGFTLARGIDPATVPGLDPDEDADVIDYLEDLIFRGGAFTAIQLLRAGPVVLDAGNTRGASAPDWIGGTATSVLALVTDDPLNVGASYVAFAEDVVLGDDASGHIQPAGLPFGSPFTPVGASPHGYFWIRAVAGGDLRLAPARIDLDFYDDASVDAVVERLSGVRRVDLSSGRPLRGDAPAGAACATGVEPDCWAPGDPLAQSSTFYDALCAWRRGLVLEEVSGCGSPFYDEGTGGVAGLTPEEIVGAILTGDPDGVYLALQLMFVLTGDFYLAPSDLPFVDLGSVDRTGDGVADDPIDDQGDWVAPRLGRHLSAEQQALLGCGAFVGQAGELACDANGLDLRLAEAAALTSAWFDQPGFDPAAGGGPMPGTAAFVALHGRAGCTRDGAGGTVVLPGCRAPGDAGWDPAIDGDPTTLAVHSEAGGSWDCPSGERGWCRAGHPLTGEPFASVMDAASWNLQVLLALLSAIAPSTAVDSDGDGRAEFGVGTSEPLYDLFLPSKCGLVRPDLCTYVDRLWSLTIGHGADDPRGAPSRRWVWESGGTFRIASATGRWAPYEGGVLHAAGPDGSSREVPLLILPDTDADGATDDADVCTTVSDPDQGDADGDGFGDRCDCDFDGDEDCDTSDLDALIADLETGASATGATDMSGDGVVDLDDFYLFLPGIRAGAPGPSAQAPGG
jgi:hypothetical protein